MDNKYARLREAGFSEKALALCFNTGMMRSLQENENSSQVSLPETLHGTRRLQSTERRNEEEGQHDTREPVCYTI